MSFSSGVFTLVAGNPVVTGTTISSTVQNNTMNDIATGLSTCLLKDGTQTATASVNLAQGLTVATSKLTVDPSTGNTVVAGTLSTPAGLGTGTFLSSGIINAQTSAAGVGNGADATDDTLFTYTLPANSLNAAGKTIFVKAFGSFANNGNTKTAQLFFAGTGSGNGSFTLANGNWSLDATITQLSATTISWNTFVTITDGTTTKVIGDGGRNNTTVANLTSNTSIIKVTGKSGSSTANDVLCFNMIVLFAN